MEDFFQELHQKLDTAKMQQVEKKLYENVRALFDDLAGGCIDLGREESACKDAGKKFEDMDFGSFQQRYMAIAKRADTLAGELNRMDDAGSNEESERLMQAARASYTAFLHVTATKLKALDDLIRRGNGEKIPGSVYRKDAKAFDRAHSAFGETLEELETAYRGYLGKFIKARGRTLQK